MKLVAHKDIHGLSATQSAIHQIPYMYTWHTNIAGRINEPIYSSAVRLSNCLFSRAWHLPCIGLHFENHFYYAYELMGWRIHEKIGNTQKRNTFIKTELELHFSMDTFSINTFLFALFHQCANCSDCINIYHCHRKMVLVLDCLFTFVNRKINFSHSHFAVCVCH